MARRLRLLPVVIFSAALFLTLRVGGIYVEVGGTSVAETAPGKPVDLTGGMSAAGAKRDAQAAEPAPDAAAKPGATAKAEPPKPAPAKPEMAKPDTAKAEAPKPETAKPQASASEPSKPEAAGPATAAPADHAKAEKPETGTPTPPAETGSAKAPDDKASTKPAGDDAKAAADKPAGPVAAEGAPPRPVLPRRPPRDAELPDPDDLSRGDLKILQELAQRRRELDQREQDLQMRDGLLKAAEKRVEEKIAELAATKAKLEALVKQHEEQQNVQLKSLVKIYEVMKPKDAAQIFDELDMTILVELLAHMKEAKSAPIMAAMDPKRVKEVTARLINRRALGPSAQGQAPGDAQKTAAR